MREVGQGEEVDSIDETEVAEEKEAEEVAAVVVGLEEMDGRYRRSIECKIRTGAIQTKPKST